MIVASHPSGMHPCSSALLAGMPIILSCSANDDHDSEKDKKVPDNTATSIPKQDLVFTRVFNVAIEQVWKAWIDPEEVMRWWGPNSFTCPVARIDFRVGGASLVCMRAPKDFGGQDMYSTWTYTKIVPRREIEWLHHFADKHGNRVDPSSQGLPPEMPAEVRNLVRFRAVGERKTELTVTEYDWPVGHMMEMSRQGMEQCLDKMAASLGQATPSVRSGRP